GRDEAESFVVHEPRYGTGLACHRRVLVRVGALPVPGRTTECKERAPLSGGTGRPASARACAAKPCRASPSSGDRGGSRTDRTFAALWRRDVDHAILVGSSAVSYPVARRPSPVPRRVVQSGGEPPMLRTHPRRLVAGLLALSVYTGALEAQTRVTTPEEFFGHRIGADYVLPNYTQFAAYWKKLDAESDRMRVVSIGKTAEGRDQLMAIVTSPENHANLERYRQIARRLALAEGLTDEEARALAREGKAVVWIDGGLHSTEVLGAQQLLETVYQLVSRDDEETLRILNDVIVLAVHANPDGMELVSDWYMREPVPEKRSTRGIPRLYQKYIGHDNNRDFYMATQPETENMNRIMFREWSPQIVYNHHQTGPTGTVMFAPPFRDPFNYVIDPLVITTLDQIGGAMHSRFVAEGKPGVTMRRGANYSTWWNGGLRTVTYFHNMIGLLTETVGNPTPIEIPFIANRQLPSGDLPY